MRNERNLNAKVVEEINGYKIVRCEARKYDEWTGEYSGRTKVYYDIEMDEEFIDSFKTLSEARRYCKNN